MRVMKWAFLIACALLVNSCTKHFYVESRPRSDGVILSFYDREGGRRLNPCITLVDVIRDRDKRTVIRLRSNDQCIAASEVDVQSPPAGLVSEDIHPRLNVGSIYHAEISADEGFGRSPSWKQ